MNLQVQRNLRLELCSWFDSTGRNAIITGMHRMKVALTLLSLLALAGCATSTAEKRNISEEQFEACWKQAGIEGDLYKFLYSESFDKLAPGGVVTEQQAASFNACIGVG